MELSTEFCEIHKYKYAQIYFLLMQDNIDGLENSTEGSPPSRGKKTLPSLGRSATEVPREDADWVSYDNFDRFDRFDRIEEDLFAARGNQVTCRPCASE